MCCWCCFDPDSKAPLALENCEKVFSSWQTSLANKVVSSIDQQLHAFAALLMGFDSVCALTQKARESPNP